MLYTIKNENLEVSISSLGAELKKILFNGEDRLHDSNPKYWGRSAPILWPNIGTINASFDGVKYPMKKHGILRDLEFTLVSKLENEITLERKSDESTRINYPFDWTVQVTYILEGTNIKSFINIKNDGEKVLPFNLGLHPAFKIPISKDEDPEDYQIEFGKKGTYEMPTVNLENGTIDFMKRYRTFTDLEVLPVVYKDYDYDALVFENINTHKVTLTHKTNHHGVTFTFDDFPMLGIWSPMDKRAPFICLEPWIGCADRPDSNGDFMTKRDLIKLNKGESKTIQYNLLFF